MCNTTQGTCQQQTCSVNYLLARNPCADMNCTRIKLCGVTFIDAFSEFLNQTCNVKLTLL